MKQYVFKFKNGKYKIPIFIRLLVGKRKFYFEYKNKLYDKENKDNKTLRQISVVVEILNIKNKKYRLAFVSNKSCDLLDDDFYEKNICELKKVNI